MMESKVSLVSDEETPLSLSKSVSFELEATPSRSLKSHYGSSIYVVLFKPKINLLLPFGPLAVLLHYLTQSHGWVFFFSLLGITPLAERCYTIQQLASYTGNTVGGLLNATFGNATEMIISIYALNNDMIRVVQQSLLGSILSNMLLVLGCAFFTGGILHYPKVQCFNQTAAIVSSGLLLMTVMGILFLAVLHFTHTEVHFGKSELALSRFGRELYNLKSHSNLYDQDTENDRDDSPEPDDPPKIITMWEAIAWLTFLTLWVSVLSGYLVDAIQGASDSWNMPVSFISVILLPIVGNVDEHASAIMFAMKDKHQLDHQLKYPCLWSHFVWLWVGLLGNQWT